MRLLIVDDQPIVLLSLGALIRSLGVATDTFEDPREALRAFRASPGAYDALITDLSMPTLRGTELAAAIWQTHPGFPITILSGRIDDPALIPYTEHPALRVIAKPAELPELIASLRSQGVELRGGAGKGPGPNPKTDSRGRTTGSRPAGDAQAGRHRSRSVG